MSLYLKAAALLALTCTGCQPSDQKLKSVRQRVLEGETVEFTKPGYSLCGKTAWAEMRLRESEERERMVAGLQNSIVAPGRSVCYRVGDTVALVDGSRHFRAAGRVRIDRVSLALLDRLPEAKLRGRYFADSAQSYLKSVGQRLKPSQEGLITLVDFTYVKGSAGDEAEILQKVKERDSGDGYEQTNQDGDMLPGHCSANWSSLFFPAELKDDLTRGLRSWFQLDSRNCFKQGQEADLSPGRDSAPLARVRITRIKRFRVSSLDAKYFSLPESYDFNALSERVTRQNVKNAEFMTVMDFEIVSTGGAQ